MHNQWTGKKKIQSYWSFWIVTKKLMGERVNKQLDYESNVDHWIATYKRTWCIVE